MFQLVWAPVSFCPFLVKTCPLMIWNSGLYTCNEGPFYACVWRSQKEQSKAVVSEKNDLAYKIAPSEILRLKLCCNR